MIKKEDAEIQDRGDASQLGAGGFFFNIFKIAVGCYRQVLKLFKSC